MKYSLLCFITLLVLSACRTSDSNSLDPAFPCTDGLAAGIYPCDGVDLFATISPEELGGVRLNDIWGWTDPVTGKEYALVGLTDGVSFVDVSDPNNPVVVGKLEESDITAKYKPIAFEEAYPACTMGIGDTEAAKTLTQGSTWRDLKVFNNHAFVVADAQPHGVQSFDLTRLRDVEEIPAVFTEDALYDGLASAHNITINESTGFAYVSGVTRAEQCGSRQETGLHILDLNDPKNPAFAGCYFDPETEIPGTLSAGNGYIHDTQCIIYDGPDQEHQGREICFSSAEGAVVITDVSDKTAPATIGFSGQSEMQYSHQGWLTEDRNYFLMNDELDEPNLGRTTKTYIWDVSDLEDPSFVGYYDHETRSIDHNLYIRDNKMYATNYTSGLRILELTDPGSLDLRLSGFFDTQPDRQTSDPRARGFTGTWSNYPFFESDIIIASDITDGLFILKESR